jgi:hypothetical protein
VENISAHIVNVTIRLHIGPIVERKFYFVKVENRVSLPQISRIFTEWKAKNGAHRMEGKNRIPWAQDMALAAATVFAMVTDGQQVY